MTVDQRRATLDAHGLLVLAQRVAASRGVRLDDLLSRTRSRSVVRARHDLWWRIRQIPDRCYSFPEIARLFGNDPSTIIAGVGAHQARTAATVPPERPAV